MPRNRGFTLLEMIIALGIFTVIWAISYGGLNRFIDQRDDITARHEEIKSLQVVFALLAQDMQYMANRSVRDGFGDKEASVVSEGHISIPE
ncbi:MAG: prepilin-type N-terminal cleavage/methylation domain-containing protein, partial [bacterium]|nr:prepilin-type N-terminal cleavage/methylation domain-containing protein [bacterium]